MNIKTKEFKEISYQFEGKNIGVYFHTPKYSFHHYFQHKRKITGFKYYKNLLDFLSSNPNLRVYFTLDDLNAPFLTGEEGLLVNMSAYQNFCVSIQERTSGRAHAFFGKHLNLEEVLTADQKEEYVAKNSTTKTILKAVNAMQLEERNHLLTQLDHVIPAVKDGGTHYDLNSLVIALKNFSGDPLLQNAAIIAYPQIQLDTLKNNLAFLVDALENNKSENDIQNWIDEGQRKYSKQRCMIFGIEYVDPKSQGEISRKKFDILAEQNRRYHVIIELKGPKEDIFEVKKINNNNGGYSTEYKLSAELARAIPQVLGYKKLYKEMSSEELEKIGLRERKEISKCIIVMGKRENETVWLENFDDLKNSLNSIEIWTYTDLVEKLENTIQNLETNY